MCSSQPHISSALPHHLPLEPFTQNETRGGQSCCKSRIIRIKIKDEKVLLQMNKVQGLGREALNIAALTGRPASGCPQTPRSCRVNLPLALGRVCQRFCSLTAGLKKHQPNASRVSVISAQRGPFSPAHWPTRLRHVGRAFANAAWLAGANIAGTSQQAWLMRVWFTCRCFWFWGPLITEPFVPSALDLYGSRSFSWRFILQFS